MCVCVLHNPQLTKDMLDSHEREPYPPMILLKVERNQSSSSHSSSVAVEVVGISERGKKFILKPKQRQGMYMAYPVSAHFQLAISCSERFTFSFSGLVTFF